MFPRWITWTHFCQAFSDLKDSERFAMFPRWIMWIHFFQSFSDLKDSGGFRNVSKMNYVNAFFSSFFDSRFSLLSIDKITSHNLKKDKKSWNIGIIWFCQINFTKKIVKSMLNCFHQIWFHEKNFVKSIFHSILPYIATFRRWIMWTHFFQAFLELKDSEGFAMFPRWITWTHFFQAFSDLKDSEGFTMFPRWIT